MPFIETTQSPFIILWYLFLVFLSLVLVVNIGAQLIKAFIVWRTRRLLKKHPTPPGYPEVRS